MGLLRRSEVHHRWRMVLPLYDGRECPDCGVPVLGREARRRHREEHARRREWEEWAQATIVQVARYAGMQVEQAAAGQLEHQADDYQRVDLTDTGDDEEEDDE